MRPWGPVYGRKLFFRAIFSNYHCQWWSLLYRNCTPLYLWQATCYRLVLMPSFLFSLYIIAIYLIIVCVFNLWFQILYQGLIWKFIWSSYFLILNFIFYCCISFFTIWLCFKGLASHTYCVSIIPLSP